MKCWHCEEELLWKGDETIEDDLTVRPHGYAV